MNLACPARAEQLAPQLPRGGLRLAGALAALDRQDQVRIDSWFLSCQARSQLLVVGTTLLLIFPMSGIWRPLNCCCVLRSL